jgi:hypothetical protein
VPRVTAGRPLAFGDFAEFNGDHFGGNNSNEAWRASLCYK